MGSYVHEKSPAAASRVWKLRLGLRLVASGFCLLAILMAAILAAQNQAITIGILGPATTVTFCWCMADSLCLLFRAKHQGIHASLSAGMDGILSLGLIVSLIFTGLFQNWWSGDDAATTFLEPATRGRLTQAAIGLGSIAALTEIALCAVSCYTIGRHANIEPDTSSEHSTEKV